MSFSLLFDHRTLLWSGVIVFTCSVLTPVLSRLVNRVHLLTFLWLLSLCIPFVVTLVAGGRSVELGRFGPEVVASCLRSPEWGGVHLFGSNVLLFVPLAVLSFAMWPRGRTIPFVLLFIPSVELLQLGLNAGVCESSDLIANEIGALIASYSTRSLWVPRTPSRRPFR